MPTPPQDDDLSQYMAKQPPRRPRPPKREVSDLTFSAKEWPSPHREAMPPPPPPKRFKFPRVPWWGWLSGALVAVIVGQPLYMGEVSDRNLLNFPPPDLLERLEGESDAGLVLVNGSPEIMTVLLRGSQGRYTLTVPPCRRCSYTSTPEVGARFCEIGTEESFLVAPGDYEATVTFSGNIQSVRSDWKLFSGWSHHQCLYGTDRDWNP